VNEPAAVNPSADTQDAEAIHAQLMEAFERQRKAYLDEPYPSYKQRKKDMMALKSMITDNIDDICNAVSDDYGNRAYQQTMFAEIINTIDAISGDAKHMKGWMQTQKRSVDKTMFLGAKNRLIPQPLGVVGLIIPWNFPVYLTFSQLAAAFAAGNRAMVKMSENSIHLTRLLLKLAPKYFPEEKLMFFEETGGVGIQFSQIPFDLILFTGSGQTGRAVMASAAKNLTPVILELGGKAPAVVDPDYPMGKAVERLMFAKTFNAGQICTNVDYVFIHESEREEFIREAKKCVKKYVPDINAKDYTSIIDDRSFQRLLDTLEDAREKGATIINCNEPQEPNPELRKMPVYLVLDTTPDMIIRQRETFGPLLLTLTYKDPQEVIDYVNSHDRPLGLYPFTKNKQLSDLYIERIMSGGVSVNDVLLHAAQHDLPFGGVGASGMGHYHGYEGFCSFSKMRPVFYQANRTSTSLLAPPYGKTADRILGTLLKFKK
jgi:coniferyl-aldehyde dehydrogenase